MRKALYLDEKELTTANEAASLSHPGQTGYSTVMATTNSAISASRSMLALMYTQDGSNGATLVTVIAELLAYYAR